MSKPKKPYLSQSRYSSSMAKDAESCTSPSTLPCEQEVMEILAMLNSYQVKAFKYTISDRGTSEHAEGLDEHPEIPTLPLPTFSLPPIQHTPEKLCANCSHEN